MNLIVEMKAEALLARMTGGPDRLHTALRREVDRLSLRVQSSVKDDKLTGQALHVRSGTLRRSINRKVEETPSSIIATVGTNVAYAHAHEYGFDGQETVRAHTRRSVRQLAVKRRDRAGKSEGTIEVREFTRHVHIPERSFLRSTLREYTHEIQQSLRAAALEAIRP